MAEVLRRLLGARAALLVGALRGLAQRLGADYCPPELPLAAEYLALDGYHPSPLGYRLWAEGLTLTPGPAPAAARG